MEKKLAAWGYEVVVAENGNAALQILQSDDPPRLALLDWIMPDLEGVEVCRIVRRKKEEPYTYIILLTSLQRDQDIITGMEAGADDYITKPFKHHELRLRLRAGRRIIELQNELLTARDMFRTKASRDYLTGLWNHGEIVEILTRELSRAKRESSCVAVIMADIDLFKKINDTHGHLAGDVVLRSAARKMHSMMRSYDFIGRYGGEEFLVILPECNLEYAYAFAERLRLSVGCDSIDTPEGVIPITLSFGVAASGNTQLQDVYSLVNAADKALYRAKENGRNRVEVAPFDGAMT
ncbi:diguanylate cyclase [Desulfurivibrio sp. D14AmB]|uniref:GGDEF domain-containing response regulator n=1 Tax=Desulfurivibrio sp. D14AmB TaxID=3374370 RepID=UPI00376F105B